MTKTFTPPIRSWIQAATACAAVLISTPLIGLLASLAGAAAPPPQQAGNTVQVANDATLRQAIGSAKPGTRIQIAPGRYQPGLFVKNLRGTQERPITIEGSDEQHPPLFEGGHEAWHFSGCEHLTLRNVAVKGQQYNGINVDDGGTLDNPSHHIVLENLRVSEVGPNGNFDGIKLSGVEDFVVRRCEVSGWGGQSVDMVGCHRGAIEDCVFRGLPGFSQTTGPQMKGGSSQIVIRACKFFDGGVRGVNIGGSTGMAFFRPPGAKFEARDITVEGCTFAGSEAPISFVGVDGATVRYNTIYHPGKWVLRILQETTAPGFPPCRQGRFENNLVVFSSRDVQTAVNIGPKTQPESFTFRG
ncbi:MAG: right-handed parallel beta-helix repeat-containing protein, partial [Planctomycetia bacterium]|nr:right-handed parallel beta-helix repeat-containing protein [Planctomycetia bacterium]